MTDVLILGGGYAGMGAAYRLARKGFRATLLEAGPQLGGHASCCTVAGAVVERFYHHYKPEDRHILKLVQELGLSDRLRWKSTRLGFYVDGRLYPFSSPMDLLRFRPLSFTDRCRFGWGVLRCRLTDGKGLENISAKEWIVSQWSPTIYESILRPMLVNKFKVAPELVSAAFLHGRVKAVAGSKSMYKGGERVAYIEGGLDVLTDCLRTNLTESESVQVRLGSPVERIEKTPAGFTVSVGEETLHSRCIINTLPLEIFASIPKNFDFRNPVQYQSVVCGVFAIQEPLTDLFWVNILDERISFRVLVNQSMLGDHDHTIVYCGNYVAEYDPMLERDSEQVADLYLRDLRRMFGRVTPLDWVVSRSRSATPVFDKDYRSRICYLEALLPGMTFAGNLMVFPGARTVSSVIGTGYRAAERSIELLDG